MKTSRVARLLSVLVCALAFTAMSYGPLQQTLEVWAVDLTIAFSVTLCGMLALVGVSL